MTKKRWTILISIALLILISFTYYKQNYLSIWGFNVPKKDINEIIILSETNSFIVTDKDVVLKIAKDVSKMKRHSKIKSFPLQNKVSKPVQYEKIKIITNSGNYAGRFQVTENNAVFSSDGYYWSYDSDEFENTLNTALKKGALLY